ncbi:MAG: site-specific integrase [Rhodospirillales bacterium]
MKLTKAAVDALTCPPNRKDRLVFDDLLPGFGVRVTAEGAKTFLLQYRLGKAVRRLRLGRYGDLTPTEARRRAEVARGEIAAGRDPVGEATATRTAIVEEAAREIARAKADAFTFGSLIDLWASERLAHRKPAYQREAVRSLRLNLANLLSVPAGAVDAAALRTELAKIVKQTARTAGGLVKGPAPTRGAPGLTIQRRVRSYAHAMYAWGVQSGLVSDNPVTAVHVEGRPVARERVLSDMELGEIWRAAGVMGWPWGPYFRFLLLTLQRESETAGLRWFELSSDLSRWELPGARTKNGRPHIVHLSEPAREIIRAAPRLLNGTDQTPSVFLFTTNGAAPLSGFSHAKVRLEKLILTERITLAAARGEMAQTPEPWRLHDLRRTGVTAMARLKVRWEVADRILNHVGGALTGIAAVYQRHEWLDDRQEALDGWARHVLTVAAQT